jgi:hypothetical protein
MLETWVNILEDVANEREELSFYAGGCSMHCGIKHGNASCTGAGWQI